MKRKTIDKIQEKCQMIANNIEHLKKHRIRETERICIYEWIADLNKLAKLLLR